MIHQNLNRAPIKKLLQSLENMLPDEARNAQRIGYGVYTMKCATVSMKMSVIASLLARVSFLEPPALPPMCLCPNRRIPLLSSITYYNQQVFSKLSFNN